MTRSKPKSGNGTPKKEKKNRKNRGHLSSRGGGRTRTLLAEHRILSSKVRLYESHNGVTTYEPSRIDGDKNCVTLDSNRSLATSTHQP